MYFRKNILVQKYFNIARNNERSARLCDLHTAPTLISISSLSKIISEAIFQWFKPGFKWFFHTLLGFSVSFLFWCTLHYSSRIILVHVALLLKNYSGFTLHSSSRIIQVLRCTPPQVLFWLQVALLLKKYFAARCTTPQELFWLQEYSLHVALKNIHLNISVTSLLLPSTHRNN